MDRITLAQLALVAAATVAGSVWLGVATATALGFMVLYALYTRKTA